MEEAQAKRALAPFVTVWSDNEGQQLATDFADKHQSLLPKKITRSQLMGFSNIVQVTDRLHEVTKFVNHQKGRVSRSKEEYWRDMQHNLSKIKEDAQAVYRQAKLVPAGAEIDVPDWLEVWMCREFAQHLLCHSLYLGIASST